MQTSRRSPGELWNTIKEISIPDAVLFNLIRKAIENSGHDLLINIARESHCPIESFKGNQPLKPRCFLKLCRLAGVDENQILSKCQVSRRTR